MIEELSSEKGFPKKGGRKTKDERPDLRRGKQSRGKVHSRNKKKKK